MIISKSQFLSYLICPKDAWFRIHQPDLEEFSISDTQKNIFDQGYQAEDLAKNLKIFEGLVEVKSRGSDSKKEVDELMAKKVPAIYQPTFVADGFVIRCDVLKWNPESNKWDLYEIKSTTKRKDTGARDHLSDAAFQAVVLERYGVELDRIFIVHLNGEFVRSGPIENNLELLFVTNDSTAKVNARRVSVAVEMEQAKQYLSQETEPKDGCDCIYYGRSSHCDTFARSHPHVPEYSVHDISYIGTNKNKLRALIEQNIFHIHEIGDSSEYSDRQQAQIETYKSKKEVVAREEIKNVLAGYSYPLYFFDYETYAPAIPLFDGYSPYERIPIQFSLHYIEEEGGPLLHKDYIHLDDSDPSRAVAEFLNREIKPEGTVLAWNVGFERSVTNELADRVPEHANTLRRICAQMQDLMDVFSNQHYVHWEFRGSAAIESVMKVLLPEISYDHLPYTGNDCGFVWWEVVSKSPADKDEKIRLLKEYCQQDTLVMVKIWEVLRDMVKEPVYTFAK